MHSLLLKRKIIWKKWNAFFPWPIFFYLRIIRGYFVFKRRVWSADLFLNSLFPHREKRVTQSIVSMGLYDKYQSERKRKSSIKQIEDMKITVLKTPWSIIHDELNVKREREQHVARCTRCSFETRCIWACTCLVLWYVWDHYVFFGGKPITRLTRNQQIGYYCVRTLIVCCVWKQISHL